MEINCTTQQGIGNVTMGVNKRTVCLKIYWIFHLAFITDFCWLSVFIFRVCYLLGFFLYFLIFGTHNLKEV